VIGAIIAFQVWGIKSPDIVIRGLLIPILGVILSPFAVIVPKLFRYFRHRERAELEPVLDSFDKELAIISHLASTYERHDLEYAHERVALEAAQGRSWNALFVGALDKIGIIPLLVAAYISWQKLRAEQPLVLSDLAGLEWSVMVTLGFVFLLSMSQYGTYLQLDRFCLVLKHAVEKKKLEPPARNADTSIQSIPVSPSLTHNGAI
jgi:hypothetical protein